jgi:PD-(D/E)XK nuclease superfamily
MSESSKTMLVRVLGVAITRSYTLRVYDRVMMPQSISPAQSLKQFLEQIAKTTADFKQERQNRAKTDAPDFQIFGYVRHLENDMSKLLRELLDPSGTHGQDDVFLIEFLGSVRKRLQPTSPHIQGENDYKYEWLKSREVLSVETEKVTTNSEAKRRVDIWLKLKNGVIGIENKPTANDQPNQLADYAKQLKVDAENWLLIYLSNREPTAESIEPATLADLAENGNYLQFTFFDLENWIRSCAEQTTAPRVKHTLNQFADYLSQALNGEMPMQLEYEISKSIAADAYKIEAAFTVANSLDSVKRDLLVKVCRDLKAELEKTNPSFKLSTSFEENSLGNHDTTKDLWLCPYLEIEKDCWLYFSFEQRDFNAFYWYVWQKKKIVKDQRERLYTNFSHFGHRTDLKPNTVYWQHLEDSYSIAINWRDDFKPWVEIASGTMVKKLMRAIFDIRTAMKNANLITTVGLERPV